MDTGKAGHALHGPLYCFAACEALLQKMSLWIKRVPTELNVSDDPSREAYTILHELGAVWREPRMADLFLGGQYRIV